VAGVPFDIHTLGGLKERIRDGVLQDARPP